MLVDSIQLWGTWLSPQVMRWVVWTGLVVLTGALVMLARTTWGHAQPLRKCIVLSLIAHTLLGIYASTVTIVTASMNGEPGEEITVALGDDLGEDIGDAALEADDRPWEEFRSDVVRPQDHSDLDDRDLASEQPESAPIEAPGPSEDEPASTRPPRRETFAADDSPLERPSRTVVNAMDVPAPSTEIGDIGTRNDAEGNPQAGEGGSDTQLTDVQRNPSGGVLSGRGGTAADWQVPGMYQGRVGKGRVDGGIARGATRDTEQAVQAALRWLAVNQSEDGRWNPRQLEAGREVKINGHDRSGAGSQADTGISALALLAFLASGNTHMQGEYKDVVTAALEFLLQSQSDVGDFYGDATIYERMYCHAMATLALSEAYAMTGDERLKSHVERAITFSVRCQDRRTGGWRYQPGEEGDTSQLGWQVMALKSAEAAGIPLTDASRDGIIRFLGSVSSGPHRGKASYRPGHRITRAMTAEAIYCRQILGMKRGNPANDEAGDFLLEELPGQDETNLYYWYYGTLTMYQLQGDHWELWNKALQKNLLRSQRGDGDLAGSWDPDPVWGAYGGRVYATAMSALCLEVYYRYLPLYLETATKSANPK